jgi:predicted HTH domain antitoxin
MKKLTLDIPDSVDLTENEARTMLAANLYEIGKLSLGQAAELAGYSKRIFMGLLSKFNVSVFNSDENDLENDIANARRYHI